MIRVFKTEEIPATLQAPNCNRYDGEDVQAVLVADQQGKCYLCEHNPHQNFVIEHLKPKAKDYYPEMKFKWENLFLACPYCNGHKPNSALILDPTQNNIEEIIEQRIECTTVSFSCKTNDDSTNQTVHLLTKLFNGENGIRKPRCKNLFQNVQYERNHFLDLLNMFKDNPSNENKQALNDSLKIDKEFLGFKYWILKDFGFYDEFKEDVVWNKKK